MQHEDPVLAGVQRAWRITPFEVKLALLILLLSLLYAVTFSQAISLSLHELLHPTVSLPRYAQPPHQHNAAEWVLLVTPALIGWTGVVSSLFYLGRRALKRGRDQAKTLIRSS